MTARPDLPLRPLGTALIAALAGLAAYAPGQQEPPRSSRARKAIEEHDKALRSAAMELREARIVAQEAQIAATKQCIDKLRDAKKRLRGKDDKEAARIDTELEFLADDLAAMEAELARLRDAGRETMAWEGETLTVIESTAGAAVPQPLAAFGKGRWSGDTHLLWALDKKEAELQLGVTVERPGSFVLRAQLTKAPDFGIVEVLWNGVRIADSVDLYAPDARPTKLLNLGRVKVRRPGRQVITIRNTGRNKNATGYRFGIDKLTLGSR